MTARHCVPRHCPKCGSVGVHPSHCRGPIDGFLSTLGAEIRRCHTCRSRHAWWGAAAVRVAEGTRTQARWSAGLVLCAGFILCIALLYWMITRFTQ